MGNLLEVSTAEQREWAKVWMIGQGSDMIQLDPFHHLRPACKDYDGTPGGIPADFAPRRLARAGPGSTCPMYGGLYQHGCREARVDGMG